MSRHFARSRPGADEPAELPGIAVQPVDASNFEATVRFLSKWVCDDEVEARRYLAEHLDPDGMSLIATSGSDAVGYVAIIWESAYAGFRSRGIPLVHQIAVSKPWRQRGVATALMDAAEQQAVDRGITTLGITVGLFDEYGPAQRMYARRGYVPDGRGACQGQHPLGEGTQVRLDHDIIIWLTKELGTPAAPPPQTRRPAGHTGSAMKVRPRTRS